MIDAIAPRATMHVVLTSSAPALLRPLAILLGVALAACGTKTSRPPIDDTQPPIGQQGGGGGSDGGSDGGTPIDGGVLAAALSHPQGIALDSRSVYFTVAGDTLDDGGIAPRTGSVQRVDRAGGTVDVLATAQDFPYEIAATPNALVWTNLGTLQQTGGFNLLPTGGTAREIAAGETAVGLATDSIYAYWTSGLGASGILVERATLAGGAPDTFGTAPGALTPGGVAVDASYLYFVGGDAAAGVFRIALTGGNVENIYSAGGSSFSDILVVGKTLYVADAQDAPNGAVISLSTAGGHVTVLASNQARPSRLAHDATTLYWTNDVLNGAVMSVPLAGGTVVTRVAALDHPLAIAVDDAIYFTTADSVRKVAR